MDLAYGRAWREIHNSKVIAKMEFFTKIRTAAREIGITRPQVYEWDRDLSSSYFTDGCLREARFMLSDKRMKYDREKDIGYFDKNHGEFTIRSFEINAWVFSDIGYQRFHKELERNGLKPSAHHPLGTIFPTDGEAEAWRTRTPLYR